ncbi:coronin-2B-like isoform X1 [Asterias rubens]|uniref:coronin-2B-like isoform X1 n=2 Tax=Asterias rubens TaxID=7604 RepID=UPI001455D001|nr:coronin-2B-like isoform X1 [Asterias rubens]XP_033624751.1 coronin-2B-like isoform X1 [Asterias rubens]
MADQDMPGFRGMRYSKFRHVYGSPYRREKCYNNIPITKNSHDANFCAVNPKFLAIILESQGGGAFICVPIERYGRVDALNNKIAGHKGPVLDIKWNPFNDNEIASSSDDGTVKVWGIPDSGIVSESSAVLNADLVLHTRRVVQIEWHPTAEGILASAGQDNKIIIWDVEQQEAFNIIQCHSDRIFCMAFNFMGDLLATTCKDKKIRILDARTGEVLMIGNGHSGTKSSKVVFAGDSDYLVTSGMNRMSNRQIALWKQNDLSAPVEMVDIDNGTGVQLLFYDPDSRVAFIAGKGDGSIRYFEINPEEKPNIFRLNEYITSMPQCGLGIMPKRAMDMKQCELVRFYKLHVSKGICEPVSMIVPRKSEAFQEDIYPHTMSTEPALSAQDWIAGRDSCPNMVLIGENRTQVDSTPAPARNSLRESISQNKTKSPKKTQQEADNRVSERSWSKKEEVTEKKNTPSWSSDSRSSSSSYSSTKRVEMSSSSKPDTRQADVEKENIVPTVSSSVQSTPPTTQEEASTLSEISSITSSHSESSNKSANPSDGNRSIASRMAMFEDNTKRGWRRAASLDSAPPPSPTKIRLTDTINEDEGMKDRGDRSPRTQSTDEREVLRISMDSQRDVSRPSGIDMVRSNGDGKEMAKTSRSSSDAGIRREFMTSKDLGMEQLSPGEEGTVLRKAFLRQQEEIKQYKSQLMLKDQRIRQLEREIEELTMTSEA